jgi:hypothetical protein
VTEQTCDLGSGEEGKVRHGDEHRGCAPGDTRLDPRRDGCIEVAGPGLVHDQGALLRGEAAGEVIALTTAIPAKRSLAARARSTSVSMASARRAVARRQRRSQPDLRLVAELRRDDRPDHLRISLHPE